MESSHFVCQSALPGPSEQGVFYLSPRNRYAPAGASCGTLDDGGRGSLDAEETG